VSEGGHFIANGSSLPPVAAPVLVVSGCSAVGKSTVSRLLAESFDSSVHIPVDVVLRLFDDPFPDPATPEGAHRYEVGGAAVAATAAQFALGGYTVILDGPIFPDGADGVAEICGRRGVSVHYAVLRTDLTTCLERARRRDPAGPPDLDGLTALHAKFVELGDSEAHGVDASGTAQQVVADVLLAFNSGRLARPSRRAVRVSRLRLGGVSLDCADPGPLSTFWADLLGGEIVLSSEEIAVVKLHHLLLTATRVENYVPPSWPTGSMPKQAHLDVDVADLVEAERRAISLGAVRAQTQPEPESYVVLFDPAGHPFCLTTQIPEGWSSD
jgi:predicted kinase